MKRTLARHEFDYNEFERRLSKDTKEWIDNDVAAKLMYDELVWYAGQATAWYDTAEKDPTITRWVPQNGGGDCFVSLPGYSVSESTRTLRFLLPAYARKLNLHDIADNINYAAECAYAVNEMKENDMKPMKSKKVCKTNIVKCLRESWDTAEIIPINEHWACGITVKNDDVIEFDAVLDCDGNKVSKVVAWCNKGTAKKDIFEYCVEKMMSDYDDHIKYEGVNLDALDKHMIVANVGKAYDYFYDNHDEVAEYDSSFKFGEWILNNRIEFVRELVGIRRDMFSSDREVAALGYAVNELAA